MTQLLNYQITQLLSGRSWCRGRRLKELLCVFPELCYSPAPGNAHKQPGQQNQDYRCFLYVFHIRSLQDCWVTGVMAPDATTLVVFSAWYQCLGFTGRTRALAMNPMMSKATITYRTVE